MISIYFSGDQYLLLLEFLITLAFNYEITVLSRELPEPTRTSAREPGDSVCFNSYDAP